MFWIPVSPSTDCISDGLVAGTRLISTFYAFLRSSSMLIAVSYSIVNGRAERKR